MLNINLQSITVNMTNQTETFYFSQLDKNQIMIINDGVMGGRSNSNFNLTKTSLDFNGTVSLKNNGGFASLRMLWPITESEPYENIQLKLKGDGRTYQFRLRTNNNYDGYSYVYEFKTQANKEMVIDMNVADFVTSFRGRILDNKPPLKLGNVQQMGLLIADKKEGDFTLILESLSLY